MKTTELRTLSSKELTDKIVSMEENLFRLNCNKTLGQLEDTSAITKARRDVARAKTVLREIEQKG
jgi:large subunit ribosomal protein L29